MLGSFEIINFVTPAYNAFHKFSMALCVLPIISIFLHKFNFMKQLDDKKNMILEWFKVFFLLFIIFNWLTVSTLFLKAGDALEAVFLKKVNIETLHNDFPDYYKQKSVNFLLKELLNNYEYNALSADELKRKSKNIKSSSAYEYTQKEMNKLEETIERLKAPTSNSW